MNYYKNFIDVFPGIFRMTKGDPSALCVYLYLAHHYCISEGKSISVSYGEIESGSLIDFGVGLSKNTIRNAVRRLKVVRLLKVKMKKFTIEGKRITKNVYQPQCPDAMGVNTEAFKKHSPKSDPHSESNSDMCQNRDNDSYPNLPPLDRTSYPIQDSPQNSVIGKQDFDSKSSSEKGKTNKRVTSSSTKKVKPFLSEYVKKKAPSKERKAAERLYTAIGKKNKLQRKNTSIVKWSSDIKNFLASVEDSSGDLWDRFKAALKWYCENVGGDYVPEAYSAKAFCDKFERIESAMKRCARKEELDEIDHYKEGIAELPPEEEELTEREKQQLRDSQAHLL